MFSWFKAQKKGCVLITSIVKEGVSINEIKAGVVADYVADWEYGNQIVGRFIRKKKDTDKAYITWFIERQHEGLRKKSLKVFSQLKRLRGYSFVHPVAGPDTLSDAKMSEELTVD